MRVLAIVFVVTCGIGFVTPSTQISKCESGPLPIEVKVNDCRTPPCQVPTNSTVVTNVQFNAVSDADSLSGTVVVSKGKQQLLVLDISDLCDYLTEGICPVKKGDKIIINYISKSWDISKGDNLTTEVTVTDNNLKVQFCFKFVEIYLDSI